MYLHVPLALIVAAKKFLADGLDEEWLIKDVGHQPLCPRCLIQERWKSSPVFSYNSLSDEAGSDWRMSGYETCFFGYIYL